MAIVKELEGGFSIVVLNLKGCGSCGDTEEEAVTNVRDAINEVRESFKDDSEEVPWVDTVDTSGYEEVPAGATLRWIVVDG